jgi:hypothetical protein
VSRYDHIVKVGRILLALGAVAFLIAAATATATITPEQANAAARDASRHATHHFKDADVKAGCGHRGDGWRCFVRMDGHRCHGTLRLTASLHAYRERITCGK